MLGCWRGSIGTTQRRVFWHCLANCDNKVRIQWKETIRNNEWMGYLISRRQAIPMCTDWSPWDWVWKSDILRNPDQDENGKTWQNTTRFHVVSSCFIRFLRMKRAASPQSLGAHGGHGSHGHTPFTYRMASRPWAPWWNFQIPISRCIHCLRPCAILCGNFAGHWTLDILHHFTVFIRDISW